MKKSDTRMGCRFVKHRGEWIAMQVNVPVAELVRRTSSFGEDEVAVVANADAAAAPTMYAALEEIAKGEGPYSRDRLEHAANCIDAMKETARKALSRARGEGENGG